MTKRIKALGVLAAAVGGMGIYTGAAASPLYWDINGTNTGATDDPDGLVTGTWDAANNNWNTDPDGNSAPGAWVSGSVATFSAGTNGTGSSIQLLVAPFTNHSITVNGSHTVGGIDFQEGRVELGLGTSPQLILSPNAVINVTPVHTGKDFGGFIRDFLLKDPVGESVRWIKTGPGILRLAWQSTTGGATITEGTVQIDSGNAFGVAPATLTPGFITFDGGILQNDNGQGGTSLALGGTRGLRIGPGGMTFENNTNPNTGVTSNIRVETLLDGSGTITKRSVNVLIMNNTAVPGSSQGFTGKYLVLEGFLQSNGNASDTNFGAVPASLVPDAITLNGGGLRVGPSSYTVHANRGITLGVNGGILNPFDAGSVLRINSPITGVGSLTKINGNLAILAGQNTYTGSTQIDAGTLQLDGGSLGNSNITIASGAKLEATSNGGTLNYNIAGDLSDLINVSGILDLTNLTLQLNASGTQTGSEYVIVNKPANSANVLGSAFAGTVLPANWEIDYDGTLANPNAIVAVLVPEPGAATALLAISAMLLRRRRS